MSIDASGALKKLSHAERQVNFATARALTWSAKSAAAAVTEALPEIFDRPTPWTRRAMAFLPANRQTLTAFVLIKDQQAEALGLQVTGGTRRPLPGSPILLPVGQRVNRYGNIPRGAVARELAKDDTFFASGRDPRTRHLPPGVYRRPRRGARRGGGRGRVGQSLKLLVAQEQWAEYRPRFDLHERVGRSVLRTFPGDFLRSLDMALASSR